VIVAVDLTKKRKSLVDILHDMSGPGAANITKKAIQTTAVVRRLLPQLTRRIHPDLFFNDSESKTINESSLSVLNSVVSSAFPSLPNSKSARGMKQQKEKHGTGTKMKLPLNVLESSLRAMEEAEDIKLEFVCKTQPNRSDQNLSSAVSTSLSRRNSLDLNPPAKSSTQTIPQTTSNDMSTTLSSSSLSSMPTTARADSDPTSKIQPPLLITHTLSSKPFLPLRPKEPAAPIKPFTSLPPLLLKSMDLPTRHALRSASLASSFLELCFKAGLQPSNEDWETVRTLLEELTGQGRGGGSKRGVSREVNSRAGDDGGGIGGERLAGSLFRSKEFDDAVKRVSVGGSDVFASLKNHDQYSDSNTNRGDYSRGGHDNYPLKASNASDTLRMGFSKNVEAKLITTLEQLTSLPDGPGSLVLDPRLSMERRLEALVRLYRFWSDVSGHLQGRTIVVGSEQEYVVLQNGAVKVPWRMSTLNMRKHFGKLEPLLNCKGGSSPL
jgi:hypothetical protein